MLQPKVSGLLHVDECSKNFPLDFFIFFSSVSGCLGNAGQADYAAANSFMDAFAEYRSSLAASKRDTAPPFPSIGRYGKKAVCKSALKMKREC